MYPRPHEGHLLPVTSEDLKAMTDPEVSTPALQQNKRNLRGNPYSWAQVTSFPSLSACRSLLAHRLCDPTQSSAPSVSSTNSASKEPKGTQDVSAGRMQSPGATGLLWKKAGTLLVLCCLGLVPRHSRGAPHVTPICLHPKKRLKLKFLLNRAFYCFQSPPKAISCPFACKTLSPKRQRPINM